MSFLVFRRRAKTNTQPGVPDHTQADLEFLALRSSILPAAIDSRAAPARTTQPQFFLSASSQSIRSCQSCVKIGAVQEQASVSAAASISQHASQHANPAVFHLPCHCASGGRTCRPVPHQGARTRLLGKPGLRRRTLDKIFEMNTNNDRDWPINK